MVVGGKPILGVTISSKVSGTERNFHMYCLPDPKNVDPKNMVPVLLGMDHLSGKDGPESALTIDFNTGFGCRVFESFTNNTSTT